MNGLGITVLHSSTPEHGLVDPELKSRNPLDCLRCHSIIKSPVRLHCQHYFCRSCIADEEKFCPICGRPITSDLLEDRVLSYVVESSREVTETCANCDQTSQPMFFCDTCHQPLCSGCRATTHKAKIFSTHNIVEMEERGRMRNRPFCSQHNEPFILYCLDSKSLMCIECFNSSSLEKRGHFVNIDLAHKICCDKLEKNALNLRIFQDELREQIELRKRLIGKLEQNGENLSEEIEQKCDMIVERVNELRKQLLSRIIEEKSEKQRQLTAQLNELLSLESPVSINLLSVSIFCSYASKMDVLHCYADLHRSILQFLSSNGRQLIQKMKFDCNFNIDFQEDFNQSVCQPLGLSISSFVDNSSPHSMLLHCEPTMRSCPGNSLECQTSTSAREISSDLIIHPCNSSKECQNETSLKKIPNINEEAKVANPSTSIDMPVSNDVVIHLNSSFNTHIGNNEDSSHDQRFLEKFQMIAVPMSGFAQDVTSISKTLLDLQRDLTLRRCVVNPEELMQKITNCEESWNRLEAHNKQVENIVNNSLKQLWRREIERIQRQQLAVREKAREIVQLRGLAKRALKVSQQLRPFATQMASLISVIDIRRTGLVAPSPMEQICSEITQIEPNSESRVAAIEKEEASRRVAKQEEEKSQIEGMEGLKAKRALKEVRPPTPKLRPYQLVMELDRERGTELVPRGDGTHSCLSSPSPSKKRQQRRLHRSSESAASEAPSISLITDLCENEELEQLSPQIPNQKDTMMNEENSETIAKDQKTVSETAIESPKDVDTVSKEETAKSNMQCTDQMDDAVKETNVEAKVQTFNPIVSAQVTKGKDPELLQAKEKLLEAIREKVKRIE